MSSPSPHHALSAGESLYALVSKGTKRLVAWGGKAQGRRRPSLTPQLCPQVPIRSALASINIVAACTSSLMITSALGSAVTISLPYVGKDLNVQKDELQWILSAYSISSVSIFIIQHGFAEPGLPYGQACFLLICGRLADLYGRKSVWLIGYLITGTCGLAATFARCVSVTPFLIFVLTFFFLQRVAGIVLDIMRGIQGIGAAAMIPASVGLLSVTDLPVQKELQFVSLAFYRRHSLLDLHVPLPLQPSLLAPQ